MKKLFLSIAIVAVTCSATIFAAPTLKLNLEKGKEYKFKSSNNQTMAMSANGMQFNIEITSVNAIKYLPKSLESDYMLVRVSFDSIVSNINNPFKPTKINSNRPGNKKNPDDLMSYVMLSLVKNPLEVKLSYTGKVIEITNLKVVMDSAMKTLDSLPEPSKSQMKPAVEASASIDMLKMWIEGPFAYLSGNTVASGDKWEIKNTIKPSGMELTISTKYKCKNLKDNIAVFTGDVIIESPENGVATMNGMQTPYELRGMGNFEGSIDTNTGLPINGKGKQKMQGSMTMQGNAMPMTIEASSEIEVVK